MHHYTSDDHHFTFDSTYNGLKIINRLCSRKVAYALDVISFVARTHKLYEFGRSFNEGIIERKKIKAECLLFHHLLGSMRFIQLR